MDGVAEERRRPLSCQSSFNFLTVLRSPLTTSDGAQTSPRTAVEQRHEVTVVEPGPSTCCRKSNDDDVEVGETTHVRDDVVLDLSTKSQRRLATSPPPPPPPPPARNAASTPADWDIYQRYVDDLRRLDELIQRRTYERNVLNWELDQTKHSLDIILPQVKSTVNSRCKWRTLRKIRNFDSSLIR